MMNGRNQVMMNAFNNLHFHARQGALRRTALKYMLPYCDMATCMPNENPPLLTGSQVLRSQTDIMGLSRDLGFPQFTPIGVLYITEETTPKMIDEAYKCGVRCVKVYPKDVTTGSQYGVSDYSKIIPALRRCGELGIITLLHGEHPSLEVEGVDKENKFLDILSSLLSECSGKFVLEHVSTEQAVGFVLRCWEDHKHRLAATITPHHLIHTHDDVSGYGKASGFHAQPILHCKPCIKFRRDREALERVVLNRVPCFFYGGDDAPHSDNKRSLTDCACGVWNTIATPSVLLEFFEKYGKLDTMEDFTSQFGANFYGITQNSRQICFRREDWVVPEKVAVEGTDDVLTPWMAGKTMKWKLVE